MKIAIVKLSALGDIIHAMVALQFIKKQYPDCQIDWIVEKGFKDVLVNNPDIDNIYTVEIKQAKKNKSLIQLFKQLLKLRKLPKYDIVIDAQGLVKSAIVTRFIPALKRFGFDKASLRESFASKFYTDTCRIKYSENIIKRNIGLISNALNIEITHKDILNKQPFLYSNSDVSFGLFDDAKSNILLIPGASFKSKIYPLENYANITKRLKSQANFVILWGNEFEKNIANNIQTIEPTVKIVKKLSLDELKTIILKADLVIGGDTGPTHMAWALNTPSITLFGSTPGYRNTFTTDINKIIESDSQVDPFKIDKNDLSIKTIKVTDIVKITQELLFKGGL